MPEYKTHQYVWRGWGFLAVVQAASVASAREVLNQQIEEHGSGDKSTPIRLQAIATIKELTPEIFHGPNAEFVLTENAETEEMLIHDKNKQDQIDKLCACLEVFYQATGVINNGYCAICRIGYRKWNQTNCTAPEALCSNEECPSRIADELLSAYRKQNRRRKRVN
jgi:hypothetical protein